MKSMKIFIFMEKNDRVENDREQCRETIYRYELDSIVTVSSIIYVQEEKQGFV